MSTHALHLSHQPSALRAFSAGLALLALSGCAGLSPQQQPISASDITWVLNGGDADSAKQTHTPEPLSSLLHVSDEMRHFALTATRNVLGVEAKAVALAGAIGAENGLRLHYDVDATLTAEEAFIQHRANCLSYTLLFIALAREVGIPAKFNEVDVPPIWDLGNDKTLLLYRHINARIDAYASFYQIVDVSGEEYSPTYEQRIIPDLVAEAQFYNNRAVELRLQKRYADALQYQLRALELAPDTAYLWTNLASLYLASNRPHAARIAVTRALQLDSASVLNYNTADHIYIQLGERRLAAYFHGRAQYFLDQNPYYHYQLALTALDQHNDEQLAYKETRRALLLYPKDPRFFFLASVLLEHQGETDLASKSMEIAIALTPDPTQLARYRSKFARLTEHG
jgi:tetratricopeptide (TPR) repeat protein